MFIKKLPGLDRPIKIVLFLSDISLTMLLLIVIVAIRSEPSGRALILKEASNMSFDGRVDSIVFDKTNHSAKTAILTGGYMYPIYSDWEEKIDVGDHLSKSKNSLTINVVKKNGEVVILDYNELVKGLRLD